jgi:putative addiction module killer protein
MLPIDPVSLRAYEDSLGKSPFDTWFNKLAPVAAAKVAVALTRLGRGQFSNVKSLGAGVHELKVDHGPDYRVYFGKDGNTMIILLGGGTKKRQHADITTAKLRWADYKARKNKEK